MRSRTINQISILKLKRLWIHTETYTLKITVFHKLWYESWFEGSYVLSLVIPSMGGMGFFLLCQHRYKGISVLTMLWLYGVMGSSSLSVLLLNIHQLFRHKIFVILAKWHFFLKLWVKFTTLISVTFSPFSRNFFSDILLWIVCEYF